MPDKGLCPPGVIFFTSNSFLERNSQVLPVARLQKTSNASTTFIYYERQVSIYLTKTVEREMALISNTDHGNPSILDHFDHKSDIDELGNFPKF